MLFQSPSLRGSGRFRRPTTRRRRRCAGFQSPSLRGSGRFPPPQRTAPLARRCFNPLHCGAVVASVEGSSWVIVFILFQSPSLRGSGRFFSSRGGKNEPSIVSIPFIAGQWSLHYTRYTHYSSFYFVSIPFIAGQWSLQILGIPYLPEIVLCLNPLHCGAVVASGGGRPPAAAQPPVSIPFIAGQWSLRRDLRRGDRVPASFQSPSLRGSGRFVTADLVAERKEAFQSPSLRGSGRFVWALWAQAAASPGFNPLHCGAVVASTPRRWTMSKCFSFNPLHCGAVVASKGKEVVVEHNAKFQSPSLRGSGRFLFGLFADTIGSSSFNPLHCGAVVASPPRRRATPARDRVSIPFIAGQWSLPRDALDADAGAPHGFQSPSLRGSGRFMVRLSRNARAILVFQSPSLRGSGRFELHGSAQTSLRSAFQSPSLRGSGRFEK